MSTAPSIDFHNDSDFRQLATPAATLSQLRQVLRHAFDRNWYVEVTTNDGKTTEGLVTALTPIGLAVKIQPVSDDLSANGPAVGLLATNITALTIA